MGCVNLKPRWFLMLNMCVEVKGLVTVCIRTHGKVCIMDVAVLFFVDIYIFSVRQDAL